MQKDVDRRPYNIIIYGIVLLGSVLWFCFVLLKITKDINRIKSWVKVPCIIKSVHVDTDHTSNPPVFFWVISYTYEYNGSEYTSSRYDIVEKNKAISGKELEEARRKHRKIRRPYKVGDKVVCFMNPENPAESVLVLEVRNRDIIHHLLGPTILLTGFLIILLHTLWYWR